MTAPLDVQSTGQGPAVLFIHGTAADNSTWGLQFRSLGESLHMGSWTRRPLPTVEAHVEDALSVIQQMGVQSCVVVGSSFGGVVALELARQHASLLQGMVLLEPPLWPNDEESAVPAWFKAHFEALLRGGKGPEAAEYFLRTVLGNAAFERMPKPYREKSLGLWRNIQHDAQALEAYRVRYPELKALRVPTLLLGGEKSAPFYQPTLFALQAALGLASLEFLPNAGHMMHAEAHRTFNARLSQFVQSVQPRQRP